MASDLHSRSGQRLSIVYRDPAELRPDPRNARTHPRKQIEQIKASIETFGFTNPVLIDSDGVLIAGHGRLLAAIPVIELAGLGEAQKRALRLADNKIALNAGWDVEILQKEFAELAVLDVDLDLSLTGFSTGEIDVLLKGEDYPDDETIPAVPKEPRTRPGDMWVLGGHRIGCGDARDGAFVRRVVGEGAKIDAAFMDPPYNVKIGGNAVAQGSHREFAMASGEMNEAEFRSFLGETLGNAVAVSRSGAVHFICMDWRHMDELSTACRPLYGALLNVCIWNKSNAGMGSLYRSRHELVFVYRTGTTAHLNNVELGRHGRNRTNV